jgi:hypothetical protein
VKLKLFAKNLERGQAIPGRQPGNHLDQSGAGVAGVQGGLARHEDITAMPAFYLQ